MLIASCVKIFQDSRLLAAWMMELGVPGNCCRKRVLCFLLAYFPCIFPVSSTFSSWWFLMTCSRKRSCLSLMSLRRLACPHVKFRTSALLIRAVYDTFCILHMHHISKPQILSWRWLSRVWHFHKSVPRPGARRKYVLNYQILHNFVLRSVGLDIMNMVSTQNIQFFAYIRCWFVVDSTTKMSFVHTKFTKRSLLCLILTVGLIFGVNVFSDYFPANFLIFC